MEDYDEKTGIHATLLALATVMLIPVSGWLLARKLYHAERSEDGRLQPLLYCQD